MLIRVNSMFNSHIVSSQRTETVDVVFTIAHVFQGYKEQGGWETVLGRFPRGKGTLLDLEFLEDESGRRVAAFGYHAGFAGAAIALLAWAWQLTHGKHQNLEDT